MRDWHACDACSGSGYRKVECCAREVGRFSGSVYHARDCNGTRPHCPVCLGDGRISDVMPASDALADAEMLAQNFPQPWGFYESDLDYAHSNGCRAVSKIVDWSQPVDDAAWWARRAARAAFRAVPGLRGE